MRNMDFYSALFKRSEEIWDAYYVSNLASTGNEAQMQVIFTPATKNLLTY